MLKSHNFNRNHHEGNDYETHYTSHDKADDHYKADDYDKADNDRRDFTYDTTGNRLKCSHSICSHRMYMGGQHNSNWSL